MTKPLTPPSHFDQTLYLFHVLQDNTGNMEYIEDMAFPTLQFPSKLLIVTDACFFWKDSFYKFSYYASFIKQTNENQVIMDYYQRSSI